METVSYVAGWTLVTMVIVALSGALLAVQQHFVRQYHCRKGKEGAYQEVLLVVVVTWMLWSAVVYLLLITYALAVDRELIPILMKFTETLFLITTGVTLFSLWTIFWKKAPFNRPVSR